MRKFSDILILSSMLLLSLIHIGGASSTTFQVAPNLIILGDTGNVLGSEFTLNITVSDAVNLYGLDITLSWNTTYLDYVSHTPKIPVETYPDGVLHEPTFFAKNDVNATAGTYWLAAATLSSDPFNGDGTVFEITFRVIHQPNSGEVPPPPNNCVSLPLHLYEPYTPCEDGEVRLYSPPPDYSPYPMVKVVPEVIGDKHLNETFPVDVWLMGEPGDFLDPFFDVSGAEIYLNFNSSMIGALDITIDPDGDFAYFYPTGINELVKEINNTAGVVRVAFNASDGIHVAPFGRIRILSVEFKALSESLEWPPPSCVIGLKNPPPRPVVLGVEAQVNLEGYQHPENEYSPWNGSYSRVLLPNYAENATYNIRYEPGVSTFILSPAAKNYSRETLWLNVTANVPVENWWYNLNQGGNISFTANTTISVAQGENHLAIYASSSGMTVSSSIQFYALTGDLDEDRDVDIFDIVSLVGAYGSVIGNPAYRAECDVSPPPFGDGNVDIFDVVTVAANYGKTY